MICGYGVFNSFNGLTAEGKNDLSSLGSNYQILEFRSQHTLNQIPILSKKKPAVFIQRVRLENENLWILGNVFRIKDHGNRPGILGVCVSLKGKNFNFTTALNEIETLKKNYIEYFQSFIQKQQVNSKIYFFENSVKKFISDELRYEANASSEIYGIDPGVEFIKYFKASTQIIRAKSNVERVIWSYDVGDNVQILGKRELEQIEREYADISRSKQRVDIISEDNQFQKGVSANNAIISRNERENLLNLNNRIARMEDALGKKGQENRMQYERARAHAINSGRTSVSDQLDLLQRRMDHLEAIQSASDKKIDFNAQLEGFNFNWQTLSIMLIIPLFALILASLFFII